VYYFIIRVSLFTIKKLLFLVQSTTKTLPNPFHCDFPLPLAEITENVNLEQSSGTMVVPSGQGGTLGDENLVHFCDSPHIDVNTILPVRVQPDNRPS